MSFRDYFFKKIIPTYFMIVTFIIIGMAVSAVFFYRNVYVSVLTLFVPPVFGARGSLPLLLDFFFMKVRGTGLRFFLYNFAELVILEICLLTAGYFIGMVNSIKTAVIMVLMIFAIFTAVGAVMYIQDKKFCDDINDALAEYAAKNPEKSI